MRPQSQKLPALADYYAAKADLASIDSTAPEAPRAKKLLAAMQKNERDYVRKHGATNVSDRLDSTSLSHWNRWTESLTPGKFAPQSLGSLRSSITSWI